MEKNFEIKILKKYKDAQFKKEVTPGEKYIIDKGRLLYLSKYQEEKKTKLFKLVRTVRSDGNV